MDSERRKRPPARRAAVVALAASLALAFGAAACGSDDDDEGSASASNGAGELELFSEVEPAPDAESVDTAEFASGGDGGYVVGFADVSLVNSWRVQARETAEIKAEEWGVDLRVTDANGDVQKQIADIEDLITSGVDALVVSPAAPKPLAPTIERAAANGIPVVLWGGVVETDAETSEIQADDVRFGTEGGEFLCDRLDQGDRVIMLRGIAGISVEVDRYEGAREAIEACGLEIAGEEYGDWAFAQGKTATENLLAAHSQIDGVWSSGADMTRGAIQAFQEANRPLVPMTGEGLNGFLKLWEDEELASVAPVYPPWMGAEAVKLAVLALGGEAIESSYRPSSPPITEENVAEAVAPNLSDDYWLDDGYLTEAQLTEIFPKKGSSGS